MGEVGVAAGRLEGVVVHRLERVVRGLAVVLRHLLGIALEGSWLEDGRLFIHLKEIFHCPVLLLDFVRYQSSHQVALPR